MNKYQPALEVLLRTFAEEEDKQITTYKNLSVDEKLQSVLLESPFFQNVWKNGLSFEWNNDKTIITVESEETLFAFNGDYIIVGLSDNSFQVSEKEGRCFLMNDGYAIRNKKAYIMFYFSIRWTPTGGFIAEQVVRWKTSEIMETFCSQMKCRLHKSTKKFNFPKWRGKEVIPIFSRPDQNMYFRADSKMIRVEARR